MGFTHHNKLRVNYNI